MRILFRQSGVESRAAIIPEILEREWKYPPVAVNPGRGPGTAERMKLYATLAGPLAELASIAALKDAQVSPDEITHLVTVTCTGFGAPGVDIQLIQSLGLRPTTQRINVAFMACHGVINAMRVVRGLVAVEPKAKVLVCSVELCTLHYPLNWEDGGLIVNSLFADGAAAMVVSGEPGNAEPLWAISGSGSCLIPDSMDAMNWRIGDNGFDIGLSGKVGEVIEASLGPWMISWLQSLNCTQDQVAAWAVHPGGPRILDAFESALKLPADATSESRAVLRDHGNMSSPTVLFVLDRMRNAGTAGPIVTLAFGPGLMAEAAFLTSVN